jgi:Zn-dependent M28 family amino/carboxypeptidase
VVAGEDPASVEQAVDEVMDSFIKRGPNRKLLETEKTKALAGGKEAGFLIEEQYRVDAYHGVADEYDESWDLDGLNQSIDVIFSISNELANSQQWPNWYDGNEFKSIRDASREEK